MAILTGKTIGSTYLSLLNISGSDNAVLGTDTVTIIEDGAGNDSSLSLSQQRATITLGNGAGDDFIVDGTTLVVEGDNNRVGIGTATPSKNLEIEDSGQAEVRIDAGTNSYLLLDAGGNSDASKVIFQKAGTTTGSVA